MSVRLVHLLLGLSLLLNAFVLAGFIYRSWIAPPSEVAASRPPQPPGPRPSPVEALANDLNLDDGQRQALRGLLDQYASARRDRMSQIQKAREQTAAEFRGPRLDMTKIEALIDQVSQLRTEQQKETLRTIAQLDTKLRPEQRERMQVILAERFAGLQQPRPRQPGAPPPGGPPRLPQ